MKMLKTWGVLVVITGAFCLCAYAGDVRSKIFSKAEISAMKAAKALIHTRLGDMHIEFFPDAAPNHVHNFIELANSKFYNDTLFHRVIPNFMIQGGDPNSKDSDRSKHGTGGPGYSLKAEFNNTRHVRGVLSMARSAHPDSAGSQFFICVADALHLDGKYTAFGKVTSGMDVADKIVALKRDRRDNPLEPVKMTVEIIKADAKGTPDDQKTPKKTDG